MLLKEKDLILFGFFLMSFISPHSSLAQGWNWILNGSGNHQYSDADRDIVVDNNGNQVIAGYFTETLTLGSITLTSPDDYYSDMFLARIDSTGNVIWAKMIDLGSTYNEAMGVCLDDSSNIFLTGAYNGKIFISKYDSSGSLKWNSDILQKNFYGYGRDISIDQFENIYVTGEQEGSAILVKLNRNGNFQWASIVQGCHSNGAWGNDLAVDRLGNCYVAGGFACDSVKIGNTVLRKTTWQSYTFLVKYSPEGAVLWAKAPDGPTNEISQVALTESGHVILAGAFYSSQIVFDNRITVTPYIYGQSSFIAKYDTSGNVIWARNGTKYESTPRDIAVDYDGNIYLGGTRFGNYGGTEMDFHLVKYNNNGDTIYSRDVLPGSEYLYGIDIDNSGNSYIVGHANIKGLGITDPAYYNPNSVYVAKFNTGSTTNRRPNKPLIKSSFVVCSNNVPPLTASGHNVRWYKDNLSQTLLASGNTYQPNITKTDTFYVTQTVNNIESWRNQVIINFSNLLAFSIVERNDSLFAPISSTYTYAWYIDGSSIVDSTGSNRNGIKALKTGIYKVVVSDSLGCSKEASYSYSVSPLEGLRFYASVEGSSAIIYWELSKKAEVKSFTLEKSGDGLGFTKLVSLNRGSDSATNFTYTDKHLFEGENYYRLIMISNSGRSTISDTVQLTNKKQPFIQIAVNPVLNDLRFSLIGLRVAANFTTKIFDTFGNLIYNSSGVLSNGELKELKVSSLKGGIYFLELSNQENRYSTTFIKL